ncbi:MAG: prepilin-type N-terminal cleavage/methylation domain-containing protein [Burkholderiaceae bacterium]|nr:prepilin-type N-terminal cleavage/methylation domain-containing protein [Burkholderiaceae bacterium]MDH3460899.1 prepilin-type N-terminal cleavage/methylation domain-containing protein [Burkholderiaceae bacterium]
MKNLRNKQRGASLLEALITFLLLSVGMLTLMRVQTFLRDSADAARQRSEAVRLAQQDLEQVRGFANAAGYGAIAGGVADVTPTASNTRYTLTRVVQAQVEPGFKTIQVTLSWSDRNGEQKRVQLHSMIAAHDPAYSGALSLLQP